jgi:hypothetical protein
LKRISAFRNPVIVPGARSVLPLLVAMRVVAPVILDPKSTSEAPRIQKVKKLVLKIAIDLRVLALQNLAPFF